MELKAVELDELEALIDLLKQIEDISELSSDQIALRIQERFSVLCSGEDIFLLHESDIRDVWYEDTYYYKNVLGL